ncbi:MAG: aldose 1-epimerase [Casimicrobiaceae bacterium]
MNLQDPSEQTLRAGDLSAVFLPGYGMLGASLQHRGAEILRRVDDLATSAAQGLTAGIPLMHPWANRLAAPRYALAGHDIALDMDSPLLHRDANGLPIHGVRWSMLAWEVTRATATLLAARLDWTHAALLAIFPFPHVLEMVATLDPQGLTLATTLVALDAGPVPVSFGFHPYVGLPGLDRDEWRLELPAMRRLELDPLRIPTGAEQTTPAFNGPLRALEFDGGYALDHPRVSLAIVGAGRRVSIDLHEGYAYAQVYVPPGKDFVALEPMTAPTNALISGSGLQCITPGARYTATFRIRVEALV